MWRGVCVRVRVCVAVFVAIFIYEAVFNRKLKYWKRHAFGGAEAHIEPVYTGTERIIVQLVSGVTEDKQ